VADAHRETALYVCTVERIDISLGIEDDVAFAKLRLCLCHACTEEYGKSNERQPERR
jgi:hypothetical protein